MLAYMYIVYELTKIGGPDSVIIGIQSMGEQVCLSLYLDGKRDPISAFLRCSDRIRPDVTYVYCCI